MRKILSIAVLSILMIFGSCKKAIDEQPISEGLLKDFLKNKIEADAAIAGMYGEFQQTMIGDGQYRNRMTWWGEARSDNWERRITYTVNATNEIDFNGLSEINDYADWSFLYSTIGRANLLIKRLPEIKQYTPVGTVGALAPALENSYMAQSLAMRGLCYFWIARVWGDAPIRTEPYLSIDEQAEQARDPKAKVLEQAISDLTRAYELTAKNANSPVWYLGEGAISAILADVYMWRAGTTKNNADYNEAIIWFKRLFASKAPTGKVYNTAGINATGAGGDVADLQPGISWNAQFINPLNSVESIFSIHWEFAANGCACMAGVSRTQNEPLIRMADPLWTTWPTVATATYGTTVATVDRRVKQTYNITSSTSQPIRDRSFWKFYAGTFTAPTATAGYNFTLPTASYSGSLPYLPETNVYIPMYRLSGMYLMYAEALNKIGDQTNAVKYLNVIKTRAGVPTVTVAQFANADALEMAILQERQYELIGEGVRWFDLVRTDRVKEVMDPILIIRQTAAGNPAVGWGSDKNRYYWPLATRVMFSNSLLVQNQPY
ncbi:MAG: RagB/SusD family nutrient uptake outer membrane protein [Pedobacter sp.]|nr:MAG: RagB/SusD family nutrient uptake outer membrane protein [Pedobacter sp.]